MSSTKIAQFLVIVGLIFTQALHSNSLTQPAYRFAHKLEGAPSQEFYDILKSGEQYYLAGTGLKVLEGGQVEEIFRTGRYSALCREKTQGHIWFAGPEGISYLEDRTMGMEPIAVNVGYIWKLIPENERIWYFGSMGYGWIDTKQEKIGRSWDVEFIQRPFVLNQEEGDMEALYVSDTRGVFRITNEGRKLVTSSSLVDNNVVSWMESTTGGFLLGTINKVYKWSGEQDDEPVPLESNYGQFFGKGISNSTRIGSEIAITAYPYGIALLNPRNYQVEGYAGSQSGLNIGDVFKARKSEEDTILVLGDQGIGEIDISDPHRFFPVEQLWQGEVYRGAEGGDADGYVFSDKHWFRISDNKLVAYPMKGNTHWSTLDPNGNIVVGYLNKYLKLMGSEWESYYLDEPLHELMWGELIGYAIGPDGLYSVTEDLELALVYPSDGRLHLLGELDGILYLREPDGSLVSLEYTGSRWLEKAVSGYLAEEPLHFVVDDERIILSTGSHLYSLDPKGLKGLNLDTGWEVRGLGKGKGRIYAALVNRATQKSAVGIFRGFERGMMLMPYLEEVGEVRELFTTENRLALIGEKGIGWYSEFDLGCMSAPDVAFELIFEGASIEDTTLPNGMPLINLEVLNAHPEVPVRTQYRINGQRWRNVDTSDPTLQIAGHGKFSVELRAVHPNGKTSPIKVVEFGIAPPWYLNPVYQVLILVLTVLTVWGVYILRHRQLKKTNLWLESEVLKQTQELQRATEARTNFLAGLSHDIRNPLNGVLMIAETLSRDPPKTKEDKRLKDITEFGIIVDRMLGEILDFSAIDQVNTPTSFIPVSIADILRGSIKQNQFSIQQAMINLTVSIPKELEGVIIKTDRNWMIKVMANLIINAVEYSGSERIEVGARNYFLTDREVDLEIYVKDWGCGVDDSEKQLIFDRFYRGESGIESGRHGTGLGLSICQEIAHAMGGHLLVEDNDPTGSIFILRGRFDRVKGAVELDTDAVLAGLKGKKVLVVDDLGYNRRSIVDFLGTIGCQCDESGNGREALNMLGSNTYDLALLDWDLPGMMGPDIAREHRKQHPEDKVILIALTAYTEADKKNQSERSGMNGYISKPLSASRLAHCLANVSDSRPSKGLESDRIDNDELLAEVHNHIEECILLGDNQEWEELRRCAHRLTTLALSMENKAMQQVCRDLQIAAQSEKLDDIQVGLAELRQWRNL